MAVAAKKKHVVQRGTLEYEYRNLVHEPLMLQFTMLLENSGKAPGFVTHATGITTETLRKWRTKKTKRPNASTLRMAFKALGYSLKPTKE